MNEKELFSDYVPKTTPDTVHDYLRNPDSSVFEILEETGQISLEKLKIFIDYFIKYNTKAEQNPGSYQEGNIAIGANPDQ
ncbi:MAG: hypothetical protein HWN81_07560 [Candidatus Lokiarchaeota archaeon]|nr:hypothetical protein [Candidatus Lokiarchaeota archaeon]